MRIIVILGTTGVGKTNLSIALAKKMNAHIINADATQVYKETNIGTAKITPEEMENIPHHMINIKSIKENYTVKDYQTDARIILDKLVSENKNIIIVGGTGLYIKALLYDYEFDYEEETYNYDNLTNEELKEKVDSIYKENNIHKNNRKRLVRFLSHYESTGHIIKNTKGKDTPVYDFTLIGLTAPKAELYKELNKRIEVMLCDGLLDEVRYLYKIGAKKAETMIGYKEFTSYIKKETGFEQALLDAQQSTRKYAKRQSTFMRTQFKDHIEWFETDYENFDNTIKKVEDYLGL